MSVSNGGSTVVLVAFAVVWRGLVVALVLEGGFWESAALAREVR